MPMSWKATDFCLVDFTVRSSSSHIRIRGGK